MSLNFLYSKPYSQAGLVHDPAMRDVLVYNRDALLQLDLSRSGAAVVQLQP